LNKKNKLNKKYLIPYKEKKLHFNKEDKIQMVSFEILMK